MPREISYDLSLEVYIRHVYIFYMFIYTYTVYICIRACSRVLSSSSRIPFCGIFPIVGKFKFPKQLFFFKACKLFNYLQPVTPGLLFPSDSDLNINTIYDGLRDLVLFIQFKKREKHSWRSVAFSKVAGFSQQL